MALGFEQRPQIAMVVNLAVENDPTGSVLVGHRLVSASSIDDRQTPMSERSRRVVEHAVAIGTAMRERRIHRLDDRSAIGKESPIDREDAADTAHTSQSFDKSSGIEAREIRVAIFVDHTFEC